MGSVEAKTLRVNIVTETYPPEINGVANTLQRLVEGLQRRGHRVHLIRPRQKGERAAKAHGGGHVVPEKISHRHPDHILHPGHLPAGAAGPVTRESDNERRETLVPGLPIPDYPSLRFGLPVYRSIGACGEYGARHPRMPFISPPRGHSVTRPSRPPAPMAFPH